MSEIFKGIPEIKYEGPKSKNELAFKFYDADRVILGKKMSEHLSEIGNTYREIRVHNEAVLENNAQIGEAMATEHRKAESAAAGSIEKRNRALRDAQAERFARQAAAARRIEGGEEIF